MTLRILLLAVALPSLAACVGLPVGPMGPGGAAPMAVSAGPTAAGLPRPGTPMTPQACAQYRAVAMQAGMMTPQLDASLRAQGC